MFNPQVVKLYWMCLIQDNEVLMKWLWKAEVLQWDMFRELIELLLIGCSIDLILIQRSKSNTSTPRTKLQTFWQRGISHMMSGIICWICLTLAISVLQVASLQWQNELNKNQDKDVLHPNHDPWWILAARMFSFFFFLASSNPVTMLYGYQDPEQPVLDDRTENLVQPSRPDYLQEDYAQSWSSQEWKSGVAEHDRSGKLEVNSWDSLHKVDLHREEPLRKVRRDYSR